MTWDKDKPAGNDKIRDSDDLIRANNAALEDALARNHNFPGTEGSDAGEHTVVELQDQVGDPSTPANIIGLYNNANGLFFRLQNNGDIVQIEQAFPSGTKLLFPQNAAPTGWTFVSENNDRVLMNQSTEANGGTTGGNWTLVGMTVDGHTLTIAQLPSHTHSLPTGDDALSGAGVTVKSGGGVSATGSAGSDNSHDHGLTNTSWRPQWLGVITCTKD